jgi:hypothetical protein
VSCDMAVITRQGCPSVSSRTHEFVPIARASLQLGSLILVDAIGTLVASTES